MNSASQKLLRFFTWVYCLSWAFDYRASEQGGSAVQFAMFGLSLASAGIVMALGWRRLFILPVGWIMLLWGGYLFSTVPVAWVNGVQSGDYLRNVSPAVLLFTSMSVCQAAAGSGLTWRDIVIPATIASVVNIIWKGIYSIVISGIPINMIRVEMLSQCLPYVLAYMMCALVIQRQWPVWPLLAGLAGVGSLIISVTRSGIFIIVAATFGAVYGFWQCRKLGVLPRGFVTAKTRHLMSAAGATVLGLMVMGAALPFVFERWFERLFHSRGSEYASLDPSALTRLAETKAFIDILNKEPLAWAYGKGMGFPYYWDETFIPELMYTYGNPDLFRAWSCDVRFPGHSIWTYAAFSGGIIGLIIYVGLFVVACAMAVRSCRALTRCRDFPLEIAILPFSGLMAFLSESITSNPFIERAGGLVIGLTIGIIQFVHVAALKSPRAGAVDPAAIRYFARTREVAAVQ